MKKRYIFLGVFIFIAIFRAFTIHWWSLVFIFPLIWTIYLINKVARGESTNQRLTKNEKIQVIITEILYPIIAGAFYYYCWKNEFPKKASQANKYSFIIFVVEIIAIPLLGQLGVDVINLIKI